MLNVLNHHEMMKQQAEEERKAQEIKRQDDEMFARQEEEVEQQVQKKGVVVAKAAEKPNYRQQFEEEDSGEMLLAVPNAPLKDMSWQDKEPLIPTEVLKWMLVNFVAISGLAIGAPEIDTVVSLIGGLIIAVTGLVQFGIMFWQRSRTNSNATLKKVVKSKSG